MSGSGRVGPEILRLTTIARNARSTSLSVNATSARYRNAHSEAQNLRSCVQVPIERVAWRALPHAVQAVFALLRAHHGNREDLVLHRLACGHYRCADSQTSVAGQSMTWSTWNSSTNAR